MIYLFSLFLKLAIIALILYLTISFLALIIGFISIIKDIAEEVILKIRLKSKRKRKK